MTKLNVHLVKLGEPVPGEGVRHRRMTLLAQALVKRGHRVTWWTSDWSHQQKSARPATLTEASKSLGFELRMVAAPGYYKNTSLRRLAHHEIFAWKLVNELEKVERPDVMWICFPVIATARRMSSWAKARRVPVIFDVRDLSPDIFTAQAPAALRPIVSALTRPFAKCVGRSFARSSGIVAVSSEYSAWANGLARRFSTPPADSAIIPLGFEKQELDTSRRNAILAELAAKGVRTNANLKLVFVGTFGRSYDIETILLAAQEAERRNLPLEFILAGAGEKEDVVANIARTCSRLIHVGWLGGQHVQVLMELCDVGLMSYTKKATQGLPNKFYEYLGSNLVILNSLMGEAADVVEKTGVGLNYQPHHFSHLLERARQLSDDNNKMLPGFKTRATLLYEELNSGNAGELMADFIERIYSKSVAIKA